VLCCAVLCICLGWVFVVETVFRQGLYGCEGVWLSCTRARDEVDCVGTTPVTGYGTQQWECAV
jgi:hypothetical protein